MNHRGTRLTLDAATITPLDDHHDIAYGINPDDTTTIWILNYDDTPHPPSTTHTRRKDPA